MKITVKITKEVLERSMLCGIKNKCITRNCGVAVAVIDIFPMAQVVHDCIYPMGRGLEIPLPRNAMDFIIEFDKRKINPKSRLLMEPFDFEIEVPNEVIDMIGLSEVYRVLSESRTLELAKI